MKKSNTTNEIKETVNEVVLVGEVSKILYQSAKAVRFTLCTFAKSKNDKQLRRYVPCIAFGDFGLEEGDAVKVSGYVSQDKNEYNGKTTWETMVHSESIEEANE